MRSEGAMSAATATGCPACGSGRLEEFCDAGTLPVFANVLHGTREEARRAPRGPVRLGLCAECSLIRNTAFDPDLVEYAPGYENALHFSPRFRTFAEDLAKRLVSRYGLADKDIVEIGCGDGHFLSMLCEEGGNRGLGFDPSFTPGCRATPFRGVRIVPEPYSEAHAGAPADLVCCRHVLEHVPRPLEFLREVRRAMGDGSDSVVYFEVPNALHMLESVAFWDVIYEHCSYFTPTALEGLFRRAGFEPIEVRTGYEGQFLSIEARPAAGTVPFAPDGPEDAAAPAREFGARVTALLEGWRSTLDALRSAGSRIVAWGAGSKGVTFLSALEVPIEEIGTIVDLNPRKHGRFVPGTGQQVVSPDTLAEHRPDAVVVMNPVYRTEIEAMLAARKISACVLVADSPHLGDGR